MTTATFVTASDGVRLATYRNGDPAKPTVVAIHGYPDNASVWDAVAARLEDRFHVVRYDVRGCGRSGAPAGRATYRLEQLERDFVAVLDAHAGGRPVHVLGHDWGSIQGWHFTTSALLQRRIASFSSISGPSLNHAARWLRSQLTRPRSGLGPLGRQLADSYYVALFQLPVLPELAWRSGLVDVLLGSSASRGSSAGPAEGDYQRSTADKLNGLQLYRANMFSHAARGHLTTELPVQVLAPRADPFVSVALQLEAPAPFVPRLSTRVVAGGHWLPLTAPELVAGWLAEFVDEVERSDQPG